MEFDWKIGRFFFYDLSAWSVVGRNCSKDGSEIRELCLIRGGIASSGVALGLIRERGKKIISF
jgi:hypothetical protein